MDEDMDSMVAFDHTLVEAERKALERFEAHARGYA
jgi:hypothetical protein